MTLPTILTLYAGLVGLVIGSYLNVVIYRLPRGIDTVKPRSRCTGCGTLIRPYDNIPVVSWLLLRGRCRSCRTPIAWRYPLIEAVTSALFVLSVLRFGLSFETLAACVFCAGMVVLAAIDVEHYILPDRITLPGIAVGVLLQPFLDWARIGTGEPGGFVGPGAADAFLGGLLGAFVGAAILLAVWWGWYLLRHEEGMGLGDVKMLAMIGAFLGWRGVLVTLFLSALSGALIGLLLIAWKGLEMKSKLPFGAFLSLGGLIALFAGDFLIRWYVGLL